MTAACPAESSRPIPAKLAAEEQDLTETENCSITWLSRPTKHVSLGDFTRFIVERNIAADVPIRLAEKHAAAETAAKSFVPDVLQEQ